MAEEIYSVANGLIGALLVVKGGVVEGSMDLLGLVIWRQGMDHEG